MSLKTVAIVTLLAAAVLIALVCSMGVVVMRDPLQRLQYSTPVTSLSSFLIMIAIWLAESDAQARVKSGLITILLFSMNGILTHVTARAIRIEETGQWADLTGEVRR